MEFAVEIFAFAITDGIYEVGIKVGDGRVQYFKVGVAGEEGVADGLD